MAWFERATPLAHLPPACDSRDCGFSDRPDGDAFARGCASRWPDGNDAGGCVHGGRHAVLPRRATCIAGLFEVLPDGHLVHGDLPSCRAVRLRLHSGSFCGGECAGAEQRQSASSAVRISSAQTPQSLNLSAARLSRRAQLDRRSGCEAV